MTYSKLFLVPVGLPKDIIINCEVEKIYVATLHSFVFVLYL